MFFNTHQGQPAPSGRRTIMKRREPPKESLWAWRWNVKEISLTSYWVSVPILRIIKPQANKIFFVSSCVRCTQADKTESGKITQTESHWTFALKHWFFFTSTTTVHEYPGRRAKHPWSHEPHSNKQLKRVGWSNWWINNDEYRFGVFSKLAERPFRLGVTISWSQKRFTFLIPLAICLDIKLGIPIQKTSKKFNSFHSMLPGLPEFFPFLEITCQNSSLVMERIVHVCRGVLCNKRSIKCASNDRSPCIRENTFMQLKKETWQQYRFHNR